MDFVLGLARNSRLEAILEPTLERAEKRARHIGTPQRVFEEINYKTLESWSRYRRVIGKVEILAKERNPRFIVTSFSDEQLDARTLYEQVYCARGEMENRIKGQQLYLFAARTSARLMRVNQVRLWLSWVAYVLLDALRRLGLVDSAMARARRDTLRLRLLKIGARIRVSVRRVAVSMASSHPGGLRPRLQTATERRPRADLIATDPAASPRTSTQEGSARTMRPAPPMDLSSLSEGTSQGAQGTSRYLQPPLNLRTLAKSRQRDITVRSSG